IRAHKGVGPSPTAWLLFCFKHCGAAFAEFNLSNVATPICGAGRSRDRISRWRILELPSFLLNTPRCDALSVRKGGRMISRAAGVMAMLLMAVPGCEVRAQIYLYPYPPPSTPPYRAPADTYIDRSPQVPYYRSRSGAWEPRAGTEANAGGAPVQSD